MAAPDRVYSAAIKVIADLGYSVLSSDTQLGIVLVRRHWVRPC